MFKYKSPLSRLLEGAGKAKETEAEDVKAEPAEQAAEPIADFNALRQALAGGNLSSDSYEETDELIPEEKMPDFAEPDEAEEDETLTAVAEAVAEPESEERNEEQVVNLHAAPAEVQDEAAPSAAPLVLEDDIEPATASEGPAAEASSEPFAAEPVVEEPAQPVAEKPTPVVAPQPAPAEDRRSRVKTTFLGFERADTHVQDLMEASEPVAKTEAAESTFPVGWLVITGGPGRGSCITLTEGLMQIGRNDDQAIQLDFGDTGISRSSHAVIAYDPEDRKCYLGHGGKANLVRLNGKPVLSTIALSNGDLIRISETSIRFTAFCDDGFDWRDA